ncbi:MAG: hypothetical protein V2I27_00945 [Erythrobacter sp.]|nr:hypothetical protein [Erythrobacter sp.]
MVLLATPAALAQRSEPQDFTLPEPTRTRSAQPEGPADERAGVAIPPRVIPRKSAAPAPSQAPPERELPAPLPSPRPPAAQAPAQMPPAGDTARIAPAPPLGSPSPAPAELASPPAGLGEVQPPGSSDFLVGEEEWVELDPQSSGADEGFAASGTVATAPFAAQSEPALPVPQAWLWALVALLVGMVAGLVWWTRQGRRSRLTQALEGGLARGVSETIKARPVEPALTFASSPRAAALCKEGVLQQSALDERTALELSLEIVRATRSVMMFTLEYRLMLWNRSERAMRDLELHARLVCAKRAGAKSLMGGGDPPLAAIARIGPHQRRTISATMQLPLSDVEAMHQGDTPLFVPLLQIAIERPGTATIARSFVIGSPSRAGTMQAGMIQANRARLHPIPLDTPPGGIAGLCANEIRHRPLAEPA